MVRAVWFVRSGGGRGSQASSSLAWAPAMDFWEPRADEHHRLNWGLGQWPLAHHHPRNGQGDRRPRGTGCRASPAVIWRLGRWASPRGDWGGREGTKTAIVWARRESYPMHAPIGSTWVVLAADATCAADLLIGATLRGKRGGDEIDFATSPAYGARANKLASQQHGSTASVDAALRVLVLRFPTEDAAIEVLIVVASEVGRPRRWDAQTAGGVRERGRTRGRIPASTHAVMPKITLGGGADRVGAKPAEVPIAPTAPTRSTTSFFDSLTECSHQPT